MSVESRRAAVKKYRLANPDRTRRQHQESYVRQKARGRPKWNRLKTVYGLSREEFLQRLRAQRFLCAICGTFLQTGRTGLHVDHNHTTHAVRGLLCAGCNILIGHAHEDAGILDSAMEYLARGGA